METTMHRPQWTSFLLMMLGSFILFTGCIKDPELISLEGMDFIKQDSATVWTTITGKVKNPNRIGGKVKRIKAKISIEGKAVGRIDTAESIKMKARNTQSIALPAEIDLAAFSSLFPVIMAHDSIGVEVDGVYHISLGIATTKIKSKTKTVMPLRQEIQNLIAQKLNKDAFQIKRIKLDGMGIGASHWEMKIVLKNDLGIDYALDSVALALFFPDEEAAFGAWELEEAISIPAGSSETITAKVAINNIRVMQQLAFNLFSAKEIKIVGNSHIHLGGYPFIIPLDQTVPLLSL